MVSRPRGQARRPRGGQRLDRLISDKFHKNTETALLAGFVAGIGTGLVGTPRTGVPMLEREFTALLDRLVFDDEVLDWVPEALTESHEDERKAHHEAVGRLQAAYARLQNRLDSMYVDKLDGRIDATAFDRPALEWRGEQAECLRLIEQHQSANESYMAEGVRVLELARSARSLFGRQQPSEKRRLLDFLVSNCRGKAGQLTADFRQTV